MIKILQTTSLKTFTRSIFAVGVAAFMLAASVSVVQAAEPAMDGMDHSKMDHSMSTERDAEGRSLYGMKHQMDPALIKELREKVGLYKNYSDAEIALSMDMMGSEYAWYISPPDVKAKQGVLILTHGFREVGDELFRKQVQPLGNIFPTALGVGMAMMMSQHIQVALDDLTEAGARKIVVVPVASTANNGLYRQWMYIFGREARSDYASVPRVHTDAELLFVKPPGDDPLVAEILIDNANEFSTNPSRELVIIASHGPSGVEDNVDELKLLANLAKIVKQDGGFAEVVGMTLQDDAPPQIRQANVQKMRDKIEAATRKGQHVIVVTNLISARSIQAKLRKDLYGLTYDFSSKGLINHPNFMKWMGESVRRTFQMNPVAANHALPTP
ncbi:MAG: hypothetical protein R3F24_03900 [Gammaproteobacteria bacterium]